MISVPAPPFGLGLTGWANSIGMDAILKAKLCAYNLILGFVRSRRMFNMFVMFVMFVMFDNV